MVGGSVRYQKNWFRNDNSTQENVPKTHVLKVSTGKSGSSVMGTIIATCFTGEFSLGDDDLIWEFDEEVDGIRL